MAGGHVSLRALRQIWRDMIGAAPDGMVDEAPSRFFAAAERARVNVTRAIRTALKRISDHDVPLGRRLGAAIRTGTFCVYEPPPGEEPVWDLTGPPE